MNSSNIKSVLIFLLINMDSIMMKTAQFLKRIRIFLIYLDIIVFFLQKFRCFSSSAVAQLYVTSHAKAAHAQ